MARDAFIIRIGGDSAIGDVIRIGENFTTAASRVGLHTCTFHTYPPDMKGGR